MTYAVLWPQSFNLCYISQNVSSFLYHSENSGKSPHYQNKPRSSFTRKLRHAHEFWDVNIFDDLLAHHTEKNKIGNSKYSLLNQLSPT